MTRSVHPRKARADFIDLRKSLKKSTVRSYKFPTRHFIEYLEAEGLDDMSELDGYYIEQWKLARQDEGIAPATFKNDVKKIKTFLRWCERSSLIEQGIGDGVEVPNIPTKDQASHEKVSHEQAEQILEYLDTYEYATRRHAIFYTLWETGCRVSGAISLDVSDYVPEENKLEFRDRQEMGTALKNGEESERNVTISEGLIDVLNDYIEGRRSDVVDEFGREPLFTTPSQRVDRGRVYKNITGYTRPCVYANVCPHDREIDSCEPAQKKKRAFGCPSSRSTHPVRRGSITHHLNCGWPKEKVSERCDVSVATLERHYNEQSKEDEREVRQQYVNLL